MRILFVRLSSFGDVLFAMPAARALSESVPGASLSWAIEAPLAPLVEGAPWVERVVRTDTRAWRKRPLEAETRRALRASLAEARAFAPDVVVDAHGLLKAAWLTWRTPARRKVGFGFRSAGERPSALALTERVETDRPHAADRALALAEHVAGRSGFDRRPDVRHLVARPDPPVDAWLETHGSRPFALLQPFSSKREKEWRDEDLLGFAAAIAARGLQPVVRWGPGEDERARAIVGRFASNAPGAALPILLAPPTTPASSARLASRAALFVGADTGPTHLAAAAGVPTLALFSCSSPDRFAPIGPHARFLTAAPQAYNRNGQPVVWPPDDLLAALPPPA